MALSECYYSRWPIYHGKEVDKVANSDIAAALADLTAAITALSEKVDCCQGMAEAVLDEVIPLGLALDALAAADLPTTAD